MALLMYRTNINPHEAYDENKLRKIFEIARKESPRIHALISLLYTGALRIQDVVGLTFGFITKLKADKDGYLKLHITAKKSAARTVMLNQKTIDAVKAYQVSLGASDSQVMFPPGDGCNPANKWTQMLSKFYRKHGMKVKSHDFRATQVTKFYGATKDIVKT